MRAYVLHTYPYRDRRVLCHWFAPDGRLVSIVNKPSAKRRLALQPFQPFWLDYRIGSGEFVRIKRMEMQGPAWHLTGQALFCGLYINELLMLLVQPMEGQQKLMALYEATLAALVQATSMEITLRHFELSLLQNVGYALPFASIDPDLFYCFDEKLGFVEVGAHIDMAYPGHALLAIGHHQWHDKQIMRYAKRLIRSAIDVAVGHRTIKSRQVMQELSLYT